MIKLIVGVGLLITSGCVSTKLCGASSATTVSNELFWNVSSITYKSHDCLIKEEARRAAGLFQEPSDIGEFHAVLVDLSHTGIRPQYKIVVKQSGQTIAEGGTMGTAYAYTSGGGYQGTAVASIPAKYNPPYDVYIINATDGKRTHILISK